MIAAFAGTDTAAEVMSDDAIFARLTWPMIAEGYRILEGKAARASDIDTVWLNGYGWPAWTGGPMYHARQIGEAGIVAALEEMGLGDTVPQGLRLAAGTTPVREIA
jgi:3-hydroxyacyl-CoA dehydrogenase